jgi:hypothetical protein
MSRMAAAVGPVREKYAAQYGPALVKEFFAAVDAAR